MVLASFLGGPTQARAALVTSFSGNTQPSLSDTTGYINFAVYDASGGVTGDSYGTGDPTMNAALTAAGMSTTSQYLYLFQDVNNNTTSDIASSSVNVTKANVTSDGNLSGLTFTQTAPPGGILYLGPSSATAGNPSGFVIGATAAQGTPISGSVTSPFVVSLNSSSLVATFIPAMAGTGGTSGTSSLWGYTSNVGPVMKNGSIQDGGFAVNGMVPTTVPEPSTLAMASLVALGIGYGLRRKVLGA